MFRCVTPTSKDSVGNMAQFNWQGPWHSSYEDAEEMAKNLVVNNPSMNEVVILATVGVVKVKREVSIEKDSCCKDD
jgi:hypothetical protein